jgi:methionyl-tRNA synthetase
VNKKKYITTALVYTNGSPHIGFAFELIQADLVARFYRSIGEEVWFLTGTDEHGLKIYRKSQELNQEPKYFCDRIYNEYKDLLLKLNISNDDFIRTSDQERHWPGVYKLWSMIEKDIYKKDYEGLYCAGCEAFVLEKDLVNGKCPHHDKKPEKIKESNYFFKLSKYSNQILKNIKNNSLEIIPETRKKEMISFIERGLEDVSFSRPKDKVKWGIPVPGDESQLIYVWGDALTNYISAIGYGLKEENFTKTWPAEIHFIGKDILKFHSIIWQGMLLSAGLELPKKIFAHGFLTVDGKKMSKSIGNTVDPFSLIHRYGADPVRYFFLREVTPTEDGDFSEDKFKERYNSDLAGGLGNLVSRVFSLKKEVELSDNISNLVLTETENTKKDILSAMSEFKFNLALSVIWKLISFADRYVENNKPWEKTRDNRIQTISDLVFIVESLASMIGPFMPETSEKITDQFKSKENKILFQRID